MMWLSPQTLFMLFNYAATYKSLPRCRRRGRVGRRPALPEGRASQSSPVRPMPLTPGGNNNLHGNKGAGQPDLHATRTYVDMLKPNFLPSPRMLPHLHLSSSPRTDRQKIRLAEVKPSPLKPVMETAGND